MTLSGHTGGVTLVFLLALTLASQPATGRLVVTALDPEGAVLPGTIIVLVGPVERRAVTNHLGRTEFAGLLPGRYDIGASLQGFTDHHEVLDIPAGATLDRKITLEPVVLTRMDPARGKPVLHLTITDGCDMVLRASLSDKWASADAVAHVRIKSQRSEDFQGEGARFPKVITRHQVDILEVFRSHPKWPAAGQLAEVIQDGGEVDRGPHIEIVTSWGLPIMTLGHEFLLFLQRSDWYGGWIVAFCADGAIALEDGVVAPHGDDEFARTWRGKRAKELFAAIRELGRAR
jgi:hypothetical protein